MCAHTRSLPRGRELDAVHKRPDESYDNFYRRGGWWYEWDEELLFLVFRILKPLRLAPGCELLELGCGMGLHAALWHHLGMRVTAIDRSAAAIAHAEQHYPGPTFMLGDAHDYLRHASSGAFHLVFARGMSWFHHGLRSHDDDALADVPAEMRGVMRALRPGGYFVLQIRTDFSGRLDETGIRHHTFEDLRDLLAGAGTLVMLTDWNGLPLTDSQTAKWSAGNAVAAVRTVAEPR
jgi:SAM-dependent methyltransferase